MQCLRIHHSTTCIYISTRYKIGGFVSEEVAGLCGGKTVNIGNHWSMTGETLLG